MDDLQILEDEIMDRATFHQIGFNDKLRIGGNSKKRGEIVIAREKTGDYVRIMDKQCGSRLYHHHFLTLVETFSEGEY